MLKLSKARIFFLVVYIVFTLLYPKVYYFDYISLFLVAFYFFFDIKNIKISKTLFIYFILILLFYFLPSIMYSSFKSSIVNFFGFFVRISPILIGINELNHFDDLNIISYYKKISNIIIFVLLYIFIINIYYLGLNPYFARIMANYTYNVPGVSGCAIASGGGYFAVYGSIFLICYLFKKAIFYKKKNFVYVILLILNFVFILKANFATAFIMMIFTILIFLFVQNFKKKKIFSFVIIIFSMFALVNYKNIAFVITDHLPKDSIISIRLNDAINNSEDSTFGERIDLMQKSFKTISENFLFGISAQYNHDYTKLISKIGLHTEWVDFFARYGVCIALLYFAFIVKAFKILIKSGVDNELFITYFITTIFLGFLNPLLNSGCFFFIFLIIPILIVGGRNEKTL